MLILGMAALTREDGAAIHALAARIAAKAGMFIKPEDESFDGWNGFNVLHHAAGRVAGLDLGLIPGEGGRDTGAILAGAKSGAIDVLYLLNADEFAAEDLGDAFVIYQGSHGDQGAHLADVILPGAAYTEKNATWVNTEGRVQLGERAVFPPGDAREDWTILRALSEVLGHTLNYDTIGALRQEIRHANNAFASIDYAPGADTVGTFDPDAIGTAGNIIDAPFELPIDDFYLTNPIARASKTMAQCSAERLAGEAGGKATGTGG